MATNTKLTKDIAEKLVKGEKIVCPNCGKSILVRRYSYKKQNTEFKCDICNEIYHPCRLI